MKALPLPAAAVLTFVVWAPVAAAAPVHQAQFSNSCTADDLGELVNRNSSDGSTVNLPGSGTSTRNGCTVSGSAAVGAGYMSLENSVDVTAGTEARGYGGDSNYNLSSRYSGIKVNNLTGGSDVIEIALNFDLSATVSAATMAGGGLDGSASSFLTYSVVVSGGEDGVIVIGDTISVEKNDGVCPNGSCSTGINAQISTGLFSFDIANTLIVDLGLSGGVSGLAFDGGTANADVNAANTFNFAATDAFDVPAGYVVNFDDASIVDNNWLDTRVAIVPLPAGLPLLLGGLAALGACGRRRC